MFNKRIWSLTLIGIGLVLLIIPLAYYTYSFISHSNLDNLNVELTDPISHDRIIKSVGIEKNDSSDITNPETNLYETPPPSTPTKVVTPISKSITSKNTDLETILPTASIIATPIPTIVPKTPQPLDNNTKTKELKQSSNSINNTSTNSPTNNSNMNITSTSTIEESVISVKNKIPIETVTENQSSSNEQVFGTLASPKLVDQITLSSIQDSIKEASSYKSIDPSTKIISNSNPTKIRIPVILINSEISNLNIVRKGDSYQWETPKWVVGYIPTTSKPNENGTGWYFGHLQSLIRNEGNVFNRLPELPPLLSTKYPIYIFLETESTNYLYRIYKTEVMPQEKLLIENRTFGREIVLVTCVPPLIYDHRLLVTAKLVGISES